MRLLLTCTLALELLALAAMAADDPISMPATKWTNAETAESELVAADATPVRNIVAGPSERLLALLESDADLSLFANALRQSGLSADLGTNGPMILLVPSNRAMKADGSAFLLQEVLLSGANAGRLDDLMALHVVPGAGSLSDLTAEGQVATLSGDCLTLGEIGGRLKIGPESFVVAHHAVAASSLYVIDHLLWRPWPVRDSCGSQPSF